LVRENKNGGKILMATNETREPTLAEIMEEIKKSKNETIKKIEGSRIAMWLTPAAFGGSIALFGLARLVGVPLSTWRVWWPDAVIVVVGLGFMFWAQRMATRAQRQFRGKWNEPPPRF
jgi:hypothetical protein